MPGKGPDLRASSASDPEPEILGLLASNLPGILHPRRSGRRRLTIQQYKICENRVMIRIQIGIPILQHFEFFDNDSGARDDII